MAALEKKNDELTHENSVLKEKLIVANSNADMLVAKAQLQCARELYLAVDAALEKGYQRSQKGFAEYQSLCGPQPPQ